MFIFAAFVYWIDRYEKEPLALLGAAFVWGAVIAAGGSFIFNTVLGIGIFVVTGSEAVADFGTTSIVAPLVEEFMKGLAVAIVFFLYRKEFDSVLDGLIYGGMVGLGFAAAENTLYIYRNGYLESGWGGMILLFFIRVFLVGWMHAFFTSFTGAGFAYARLSHNPLTKLAAPLAGYALAVLAHAFHNTFGGLIGGLEGLALGTLVDWIGWALMFGFILWMVKHERDLLKKHLLEEVSAGFISQRQYQTALSPWNLTVAGFSGGASARFYKLCGELAHKKEQISKMGDEGGNAAIIQSLREQLALLSPQVKG